MSENVSKAEFINYLLDKKHGSKPKPTPIIFSQCDALEASDVLKSFDSDFSSEELFQWLERVELLIPSDDNKINDLIFGILYSSETFIKMIRDKEFGLPKISQFYKDRFQENKKFIAEFNKQGQGRININVPQRVVTRFPPEPSGYLHIGHAKAAILNKLLAGNGKLIVRFDDTNPEKESDVFENAIMEDLELLNITDYTVTHSSDYFDRIFDFALKLIRADKAYVDNTDVATMRQQRTDGIPSKNRNMDTETNLKIFAEMKDGKHPDYCLRAKISFDNPNKAMRDPVIYRTVLKKHHRTGDRYFIYPTYDFTVPILDSLEGVTLSLRTNEYRDRNAQYYWFIEALGLQNKPKIHDFSRLCFENTVVSKRQMKFYVENHFVSGWDDPRLCTLRGLRRLGMDMGALVEYIKLQGASQKTSVNSWDKIWAMNRKIIDSKSPRYSAVPFDNHVLCSIEGVEEAFASIPKYKKDPALGAKTVFYTNEIILAQEDAAILRKGEEFTLMNWGNAIVTDKTVVEDVVVGMELQLYLSGDFKATENKITWISRKGATQISLFEYSNLQNDIDTEDLAEKYNKDSKKHEWWITESAINDVQPGDFIQIERVGFFICDQPLTFNLVPFTRQKRVY